MSITALDPAPSDTAPTLVQANLFTAPDPAAVDPTPIRRFPEAFGPGPDRRGKRCPGQKPGTETPARSLPEQVRLDEDFRADNEHDFADGLRPKPPTAAARAVAEKLFPPMDGLLAPAESVAAVVHAAAPAVLEVLAGARPARQLLRALSPECMLKLDHHMRLGAIQRPDPTSRCYSNPRVLRMRITQVLPLVFEAAVIIRDMQNVRAAALRIERWHGRWQVTALEIG
ncbi:Rv3235 family protein [Paeniglutamicibacter psychrophenolicus]|uniref:Rv3235 family protein n=1 Tax=Paeniglutamicibacter psychrophenolicus TaxID=257454 RepID=UPI00278878EA|nr:Rv3235 family protein [Paeniglutamicibacter psychrophenolicus]MDQ0095304.1 hypothetical protein [Paeniglutamicibacter psychrophenolicus]